MSSYMSETYRDETYADNVSAEPSNNRYTKNAFAETCSNSVVTGIPADFANSDVAAMHKYHMLD